MTESKFVDELFFKLKSALPLDALNEGKHSLENELKIMIQEFLSGLDLVSREEFDIQSKVLAKTRAKIESLTAQLDAIEAKINKEH